MTPWAAHSKARDPDQWATSSATAALCGTRCSAWSEAAQERSEDARTPSSGWCSTRPSFGSCPSPCGRPPTPPSSSLTRFTAGVDPRALRDDRGARLAHWQGLLERQPTQTRQILRKLLVGRHSFEPFEDAAGRGYHIRGQATYGRLLSGVVSVVPPG